MSSSFTVRCDQCSVSFQALLMKKAREKVFSHWLTYHTKGSSADALRRQRNLRHLRRSSTSAEEAACDECNKGFRHLRNLAQHCSTEHGLDLPWRSVTPKASLLCDLCGKACLFRDALHVHHLRRHVRLVLRRGLERTCEDCDKGSVSRTTLFRHWIRVHSGKTRGAIRRVLGVVGRGLAVHCAVCDRCGRQITKHKVFKHHISCSKRT